MDNEAGQLVGVKTGLSPLIKAVIGIASSVVISGIVIGVAVVLLSGNNETPVQSTNVTTSINSLTEYTTTFPKNETSTSDLNTYTSTNGIPQSTEITTHSETSQHTSSVAGTTVNEKSSTVVTTSDMNTTSTQRLSPSTSTVNTTNNWPSQQTSSTEQSTIRQTSVTASLPSATSPPTNVSLTSTTASSSVAILSNTTFSTTSTITPPTPSTIIPTRPSPASTTTTTRLTTTTTPRTSTTSITTTSGTTTPTSTPRSTTTTTTTPRPTTTTTTTTPVPTTTFTTATLPTTTTALPTTTEAPLQRTIIFVQDIAPGKNPPFIRGGLSRQLDGSACPAKAAADVDPCAIPIISYSVSYSDPVLAAGDDYLDFTGLEGGQHFSASGSPLYEDSAIRHPLNSFGVSMYVWDVTLNCSRTKEGWFEFKVFTNGVAETDKAQPRCTGSFGGMASYTSGNRFARCGQINMYNMNSHTCTINYMP